MQRIQHTTPNLCHTCSLHYRSFFIPQRRILNWQASSWMRSYSQSHDRPHEESNEIKNNNDNNNPLGNVLDRELDAVIHKEDLDKKPVQSSSARDLQKILDALWPETEAGPIIKEPKRPSIFQAQDPHVTKKTQRIQSQIEKQLLNMVRKSRQPHKKTSPLPRGMMGSFYGKPVFQKSRRPMDEPAIIKTTDESIVTRDKEMNAVNSILACTTRQELLDHVIGFTTTTDEENYPPYYAKLLMHAIEQAGVTFQDPYLALSIFEHAKTHSVMSYVAGCTTQVYNVLLIMRWRLWQDVHGMLHLVDEMMINGINYDAETRRIVQMVISEVENEMLLEDHPEEERWDYDYLEQKGSVKDGMVWSMDERRSANIMKALVGKWLIK